MILIGGLKDITTDGVDIPVVAFPGELSKAGATKRRSLGSFEIGIEYILWCNRCFLYY